MKKKIAILWKIQDPGLYSNQSFDFLNMAIGHNNGNLAFVYAIARQVDAEFHWVSWATRADVLNQYDAVLIPCANQFGAHNDLGGAATIMEAVDKPVIAIGLGAQADTMETEVRAKEGTVNWVKAIDARRFGSTSNIYTRGPYTSQQLARFGIDDTIVGGCPTHFISHDVHLGRSIQAGWDATSIPRSLSVCAGHQGWGELRPIEQQLIALMMDPTAFGQYVVQATGEMIKLSRGLFDDIDPNQLEILRLHTVPHYTMDEFKSWCRTYARSFYDVPAWMDALTRYDLTIGPRYHGTQLAIQAAKMGCVVAFDSRTEEMCRQTGVPFLTKGQLAGQHLTRGNLKALIKFDGEAYDAQRRERAQNYVTFLRDNGLDPREHLLKIAGE
ncbi:hypothetical protein ABAC460_14065 [Asticcacaulis sp. AC460]|uniref:polysaccharide pyruvyl transferase family protein n=1 Tax=Asticcacaulis sp. AC460 TaxID=1282360 RepID=UPI0003C3F6C8|nr:polysaccharide pyruvyl transferase family protein [Asticcacaulis sp. AC460]ESQ88902.1 hypothetical protein ABAC460_14065 [Asticcacaulis sp. AC460]